MTRELEVPAEADGSRLDSWLGEALGLSRAKVKALFESDAVRVDGRRPKKGDRARTGTRVRLAAEEPEGAVLAPDPSIELRALYLDADLVAVDKRSGVAVHPLRPGEVGTVANALVARWPECAAASEDPREGGLCHRLDVETSGVLLAARNRAAWSAVREAFSRREVEKRYWALVSGPLSDEGVIELPLRHHRRADRVEPALDGEGAREAVTRFAVLGRRAEWSLVEVEILTGVLHQIRAHLAAIGAPVANDALYSGRPVPGLDRFFLHAHRLGLAHPVTGGRLTVDSPLASDLIAALEALQLDGP